MKDLQVAYKTNLKLFQEMKKKKKIDRGERKKSVLSDLHTARQGWGGKSTFVSELQQCVNIFSQFTIFCEKKQQKSKEFHKK